MENFKIRNKDRQDQYKNMIELIQGNIGKSISPDALKATRARSILNSYRLIEAYKNKSKVAYVNEQFPNEIVFAFDMLAWNIESMAILLTQSINVDRFYSASQENFLSRDICTFLRTPYGVMLENCYPTPDIILGNDQPCDCLAKLEYFASKLYNCSFYTLNTPNYINEVSISYLVKQLRRIISKIEDTVKVKFDEERFKEVVEYSNQAKEYYCKTIDLLKTTYLPGVARELLEIFGMNYFGLKETVKICKLLYEEALAMSNEEKGEKSLKRILWLGQAPGESHELVKYLENEIELIYWGSLWDGNLIMLDPENPLKSIAHRAILYHWNADRMKKNVSEVFEQFNIEGVIIANVWGCRNMVGVNSVLREVVKNNKLKYLTINTDINQNNFSFNQVKNRVDAFLEII